MNREQGPAKSPEEMYIQQKVRVLLMLKKMGSNVSTPPPPSHTHTHTRAILLTAVNNS